MHHFEEGQLRPKPHWHVFAIALVTLLLITGSASAQMLRQMEVTEVPDGESIPYIVTNTEEAILIVHSTIMQMQFESTNPILQVGDDGGGEYILHLRPGTNVIKFKADGFVSVQERYVIGKKKYKEVRVVPKRGAGEKVETGTVEFRLNPGPVLVITDGSQTGQIRVKNSGIFRLNLDPGKHSVKLVRDGNRYYEGEFDVKLGETVRDSVVFSVGDANLVTLATGAGTLLVRSNPDGASVSIDGAEAGTTPFEIREIAVGEHQIRLEKRFYRPVAKAFEIASDDVLRLTEELPPDFGELTLRTVPPKADVYFDGTYSEKAPLVMPMVETGVHTVTVRMPRYHEWSWTRDVAAGDIIDTTAQLLPAFGSLSLNSTPEGASVYLGTELVGRTPLMLDTVMSGNKVVRLEKSLYSTTEIPITISDDKKTVLTVPLDQNFGTLNVTSEPTGMEVRLLERSTVSGKTPFTTNIAPGSYTVEITDSLYETYSSITSVNLGANTDVHAPLTRKAGLVKVFSKPLEAEVYLDGKLIGEAPVVLKRHPTGKYRVEARKMGFKAKTKDLVVNHNAVAELEFDLDRGCPPNMGIFDFSELRNGMRVYYNGEYLGETPLQVEYKQVSAGSHTFEFKRDHCESSGIKRFALNDQQTIRLKHDPVPKSKGKAALRSFILPGFGQFYSEKKLKGTVFLVSELASLGYLAYSYSNHNTKKQEYEDALEAYTNVYTPQQELDAWDVIESTHTDYSRARDQLSTAFIIPVAIHAVNVLDAMIFGGAPKDAAGDDGAKLAFDYGFQGETVQAKLSIRF